MGIVNCIFIITLIRYNAGKFTNSRGVICGYCIKPGNFIGQLGCCRKCFGARH